MVSVSTAHQCQINVKGGKNVENSLKFLLNVKQNNPRIIHHHIIIIYNNNMIMYQIFKQDIHFNKMLISICVLYKNKKKYSFLDA